MTTPTLIEKLGQYIQTHKTWDSKPTTFYLISECLTALQQAQEDTKWIDRPTGPGAWWYCAHGVVTLEQVYQRDAWSPYGLCIDDAERSWEDSLCATLPGVWLGPVVKPEPPTTPAREEGEG